MGSGDPFGSGFPSGVTRNFSLHLQEQVGSLLSMCLTALGGLALCIKMLEKAHREKCACFCHLLS